MEIAEHFVLIYVPGLFMILLVWMLCIILIKYESKDHRVMDAIVKVTLGECWLIEPGSADGHVSDDNGPAVNDDRGTSDNDQASVINNDGHPHEGTPLVARTHPRSGTSDNDQASVINNDGHPHEGTPLVARRHPRSEGGRTRAERHYVFFVYIIAMVCLSLIAFLLWIALVEQITDGTCIQGADCFIFPQNSFVIDYRRVNCSTYEPDADYMLRCLPSRILSV